MDDKQKKFITELMEQGYHVVLDKNNDVLFASYWHPDLIISKIDLKDYKNVTLSI